MRRRFAWACVDCNTTGRVTAADPADARTKALPFHARRSPECAGPPGAGGPAIRIDSFEEVWGLRLQANSRIERNISPPMGAAITLPALIDRKDIGVAVYVVGSAFSRAWTDADVHRVAARIARMVNR